MEADRLGGVSPFVKQIESGKPQEVVDLKKAKDLKGPSFEDSLSDILSGKVKPEDAMLNGKSASEGLKFSNHAIERMRDRGIALKPDEMVRLNEAVEKAAKKGSRESLMLLGDTALIVSVKNKTVVTAMDRSSMKDKVFSNIDSTMIL